MGKQRKGDHIFNKNGMSLTASVAYDPGYSDLMSAIQEINIAVIMRMNRPSIAFTADTDNRGQI